MMPTDNHVHSRWSWDTATASSMQLACARAVEIGLPGVAFTEHVDFTDWSRADAVQLADRSTQVNRPARVGARPRVAPLDVERYSAELARCREAFPELRVLSGIEAGEPHLFPVRREELAQLAGISVDYVTRLEQGRATHPSEQVVEALGRALRLSGTEREHLFHVAGLESPDPLPRVAVR